MFWGQLTSGGVVSKNTWQKAFKISRKKENMINENTTYLYIWKIKFHQSKFRAKYILLNLDLRVETQVDRQMRIFAQMVFFVVSKFRGKWLQKMASSIGHIWWLFLEREESNNNVIYNVFPIGLQIAQWILTGAQFFKKMLEFSVYLDSKSA